MNDPRLTNEEMYSECCHEPVKGDGLPETCPKCNYICSLITYDELITDLQEAEAELCDGCNVQGNWEHRCHGKGCDCDSPVCMEKQGKITHKELMEIVNNHESRGKESTGTG